MIFPDYDIWQTCVLVPGLTAGACASWVQAWGSIGALAIAVGLQVWNSVDRVRGQNQTKFEAINSAIVLSGSIANAALALKRQLVLPAHDQLGATKKRFAEHKAVNAALATDAREPFRLDMQLDQMPTLDLPVDLLLDLVVMRIASNGRACAAACELKNAHQSLNTAIGQFNDLQARFMRGEIPEELHGHHYLGEPLPGKRNQINREYPDLLDAVLEYANQVAFFGAYISTELQAHGDLIRPHCGPGVPATSRVDFSGPRASGLMPPDEDFGRWLQGIVMASGPAKWVPWYRRLRRRGATG